MNDIALRGVGDALRADRTRRRKRLRLAGATMILAAALGVTIGLSPSPRLLWNASASAPIGLWRVAPNVPVERGDMVVARLVEPWRSLAARRRYLPANVPLIKRIAAEPGDRVCAIGLVVTVNGAPVASRLRHDSAGRPMPQWQGCRLLRDGAMLLLMDDPGSFDGRYFGPTARRDIIGKAYPLWLP
ncbi:MAG: S26 family signal peptidase [Candidatus Sphingomonas phytovorans]|nr:S26 family signal peptidase [Sphingomonas sp.]WEK02153.1 MAG: S26 family signal peptidase [Sphingomonas sp.]